MTLLALNNPALDVMLILSLLYVCNGLYQHLIQSAPLFRKKTSVYFLWDVSWIFLGLGFKIYQFNPNKLPCCNKHTLPLFRN